MAHKIDYYNLFLNHILKELNEINQTFIENVLDLFNEPSNEIFDDLNFYKINVIFYRLLEKYFKNNKDKSVSPTTNINSISIKIPSFANYFLKNFHVYFHKEKNENGLLLLKDNYLKDCSCLSSNVVRRRSRMDMYFHKLPKRKFSFDLFMKHILRISTTTSFFENKKLFLDLYLYFNAKLIRWKEEFFGDDKFNKKERLEWYLERAH